MSAIDTVHARQVFDSRGEPTVEVDVVLRSGARGRAAVPAGACTGRREAVELRDERHAFAGRGVERAVANVNGEIARSLRGRSARDQAVVDCALIELDGTEDKRRLGANAILGVSLALARARADERQLPLWRHLAEGREPLLPMPMLNVLNGGVHADNAIDFQEFMIVPVGARSFSAAMRLSVETYHQLRRTLRARGLGDSVGDEGGFVPDLRSNEAPLELLLEAIETAGYRPGEDVAIALDPATSGLRTEGAYRLRGEGRTLGGVEMVDYWCGLAARYPIVLLEDGMAEDDWQGWKLLTSRLGDRIQLVGDDIFVTNPGILRQGIQAEIANSILIKPNQIGTLTETLETIELAREAGYRTVISHRSGETEDPFIADLVVATGAGQIKAGAPAHSERLAKYNQLLRIEEEAGTRARFAGRAAVELGSPVRL